MGEGGEGREPENRVSAAPQPGAFRLLPLEAGIALYFPPLRAAGAALMLGLFGVACSMIALASIGGLARSGETETASMLALAFAGVFALPLFLLGQLFLATALWTAGNSLYVEIGANGIRTERKWLGYPIARRAIAARDIGAVESRLGAKYLGVFSGARYYRIVAAPRGPARALLIADSLHGRAETEQARRLVLEHLRVPALDAAGKQAHQEEEDT